MSLIVELCESKDNEYLPEPNLYDILFLYLISEELDTDHETGLTETAHVVAINGF